MDPKVPISALEPGELFDDSLPNDAPSRERLYRVVGVRTRTVLAENVPGIRRSFTKEHEVVRATKELWDRMAKLAVPATPYDRAARKAAERKPGEVA
jgi:hypothetical protein